MKKENEIINEPKATKTKVSKEKPPKLKKEKAPKEPRKMLMSMEKRAKYEAYVFVTPLVIGIAVFFLFALFLSLRLSFGDIIKMTGFQIKWVGLDNYMKALMETPLFPIYFGYTVNATISKTPLIVIFSLLLAIIISKKIKFRGFFRVVFFLPFILGTGYVLAQLRNMGAVGQALSIQNAVLIPVGFINYLGPQIAKLINDFLAIIVDVLWSSGVQILLFLSGLQSISPTLYESASVDGATEWEKFWKITLPMIMPTMVINIIFTLTDSFTSITNPLVDYLRQVSFIHNEYELAAAMGWLFNLFVLVLVGIVFLIFGRSYASDTTSKGGLEREIRKSRKKRYKY